MDTYNDLPKSLLLYCHLRNIFPKTLKLIVLETKEIIKTVIKVVVSTI
jgi:hypothetical protein